MCLHCDGPKYINKSPARLKKDRKWWRLLDMPTSLLLSRLNLFMIGEFEFAILYLFEARLSL